MRAIISLLIFYACAEIEAREFTDAKLSSLPKLFHLDDYHRCLAQRHGLYCMATFDLTPVQEPHPIYELIKEYSSNRQHYNRSLIHRGYCVSARCPDIVRQVQNATVSVQQCVDKHARAQNFRATLHKFHYCHNNIVHKPDIPKLFFLYIVYGILFCNIVGTVYDLIGGKNKRMLSWSVISNWRQMVSTKQDEKDPRLVILGPINGSRVILSLVIMWGHSIYLYTMLYVQNPRDIELSTEEHFWITITNGTTMVQLFVMISSFLCVYTLLLQNEKKKLNFSMMPIQIIRRYIRIAPVHLLIVGYCATWWIDLRDGPEWWAVVGEQRDVCRRKFWTHVLFINNLVEPEDMCQLQTWFMALNIQMFIISIIFTILLAPLRQRAFPILLSMFGFSCIFLSILAYINNWRSLLMHLTPEVLRTTFYGGTRLTPLYLSPLGNLPACIMGSLVAHLQYELQNGKFSVQRWKCLRHVENWFIPIFCIWFPMGRYVRDTDSDFIASAYVCIERFVFCTFCGVLFLAILNGGSWFRRFCLWSGWTPLSNLNLAVMMTHWAINITITVSRHQPNAFSFGIIVWDAIATNVLAYALAAAVTVLVESPMRRFFDIFIK